jgi:hypothetical protein
VVRDGVGLALGLALGLAGLTFSTAVQLVEATLLLMESFEV